MYCMWYLHGDKIFLQDDSWKQAYEELWMKASVKLKRSTLRKMKVIGILYIDLVR